MVITKPQVTWLRKPPNKARCAQVILTPEETKSTVFNKGMCNGFNTAIDLGGQVVSIKIEGFKLAWKKAQKNEKKNITSDTINKIIP